MKPEPTAECTAKFFGVLIIVIVQKIYSLFYARAKEEKQSNTICSDNVRIKRKVVKYEKMEMGSGQNLFHKRND